MPLGSLWHQAWNECKIIHDASCFHLLFYGADELTSVLVSLKIHSVSEGLFIYPAYFRVQLLLHAECKQYTRLDGDPLHRILMSVLLLCNADNHIYYCKQPIFLPEEFHWNDWVLLLIASVHSQWVQAVLPKDVRKVREREKRDWVWEEERDAFEC